MSVCARRSLFPLLTVVLLAGPLLALTACQRKAEPPFDPRPYETPSARAVLRHLLAEALEQTPDAPKVGVIVLGENLRDATPDFRSSLADTGIEWHPGSAMTQVWVGPIARIIEKNSKLQPIQLQVVSVTKRDPSEPDSPEEVVAAWAYEDRMKRQKFLATPAASGSWSLQPLEILEERPAPSL